MSARMTPVKVVAGHGQWAYWRDPVAGEVIADTVCQHMAGHFAGKLTTVVDAYPCDAELQLDGFLPERPKSVWANEVE